LATAVARGVCRRRRQRTRARVSRTQPPRPAPPPCYTPPPSCPSASSSRRRRRGGDSSGEVPLLRPRVPSAATLGLRARRWHRQPRNRGPSAGGHGIRVKDTGGARWERRCRRRRRPGGAAVRDADCAGRSGNSGVADHSGAAGQPPASATTVARPGRAAPRFVAADHAAGSAAADWAGVADQPDGADGVATIAGRADAPQPDR